jgi:membrane dipeptidase
MPAPVPILDGHNDTVLRLQDGETITQRSDGHVDLVKAREGGLIGGFCALFVRSGDRDANKELFERGEFPKTPSLAVAQQRTFELLAILLRLERATPDAFSVVRSTADIDACISAGRFAAILHIEGAEAIDADLNALEVFYAAGVRSLGPVWSRPNRFGHGVPISYPGSPDCGAGLTKRGRALIGACNQLGIVIDVSHMTERGFWDVARLSNAPLVATHSNAHALTATPRNLTDRQLNAVGDSGGVVGINFAVNFLRDDGAEDTSTPLTTLIRHLTYVVEKIGVDHVALGSDFDGAPIPDELGDAAGLPRLVDALREHGYSETETRKLCLDNWLRVLDATWR